MIQGGLLKTQQGRQAGRKVDRYTGKYPGSNLRKPPSQLIQSIRLICWPPDFRSDGYPAPVRSRLDWKQSRFYMPRLRTTWHKGGVHISWLEPQDEKDGSWLVSASYQRRECINHHSFKQKRCFAASAYCLLPFCRYGIPALRFTLQEFTMEDGLFSSTEYLHQNTDWLAIIDLTSLSKRGVDIFFRRMVDGFYHPNHHVSSKIPYPRLPT